MTFKNKYSLIIFPIWMSLLLTACSEPISFELNSGESRESDQPYNLSENQIKHADAMYVAIRDKNLVEISKLASKELLLELEQDPTALIELSSYIPFYEKLISKKMIDYKKISSTKNGKLIQAIFKYEYETRTVFYSVFFRQNDPAATIVGMNLKLEIQS